jgi:NAD(P)-dependent dehydrogenase (short-subunit alcohol dehydrogenase family)
MSVRLLALVLGAVLWANTLVAAAPSAQQPAADSARVLVVGATRGTGLETVRLLIDKDIPVVAFARPASDLSALEALQVDIIAGDALVAADMTHAIEQGPWRAVVTTLGCNRCDNPPDFEGNRNLFDAMASSTSRRVVMISTIGAGDSKPALPWFVRWILRGPIALKEQAEAHLVASGLDYTIIRPGNLDSDPASGQGLLVEDPTRGGSISRADLAILIVSAIENDATIGKTYNALSAK